MMKYLLSIAFLVSNFAYANIEANNCSKVTSDQERLNCYDLIFKTNDNVPLATDTNKSTISANQTKELDKLITENNKASKDSEFGLPKTKTKNLLKNSIKTSIVNIKKTKNGKLIFTLKNGQKWIAETSYRARNMFKPKTIVNLEEAQVSGFYMVNISNKQKIRIKRLK